MAVVLASPLWLRAHSLGSGVSQGHLSPSGDPDPAPRRPWTDRRAPPENPCFDGSGGPLTFYRSGNGPFFFVSLDGHFFYYYVMRTRTSSCPHRIPIVTSRHFQAN